MTDSAGSTRSATGTLPPTEVRIVERLDLDRVKVRNGPVRPIAGAEIDALGARLGVRMPDGYRAYLGRLGDGSMNLLAHVLPPAAIIARLEEHEGMMAAYWLWGEGVPGFGQLDALRSIPVVDTDVGAIVVMAHGDPGRLFVLGRDEETVIVRPGDILDLVGWLLGGALTDEVIRRPIFEPSDARSAWVPSPIPPPPATEDLTPPDLQRAPREVLLAYFAELAAVEAWGTEAAGGREVFTSHGLDIPDAVWTELRRRADLVYRRYTSPAFARAMDGSMGLTGHAPHDAATVTIDDETELQPGTVQIRASHDAPYPTTEVFTLRHADDGWRIIAARSWTDPSFVPPVFDGPPPEPTLDDIADLARMMDIDEEAIADLQREYLRQMHGGGPGLVGRIRARFRRD
jgi:hypothetical protein